MVKEGASKTLDRCLAYLPETVQVKYHFVTQTNGLDIKTMVYIGTLPKGSNVVSEYSAFDNVPQCNIYDAQIAEDWNPTPGTHMQRPKTSSRGPRND